MNVRLWHLETGRELRRFEGHTKWVNTVAFSPDSKLIASGSDDKTARLWDAASGKELFRFEAHQARVGLVQFSRDGRQLLCAADRISIWDTVTGKQLKSIDGQSSIAFSPDGSQILTVDGASARLLEAATLKELNRFDGHAEEISSAVFSADGRQVLTGSDTARLFDVVSGKEIRRFDALERRELRLPGGGVFRPPGEFPAGGPVYAVAFSPDRKTILSTTGDEARLWDLDTGKERHRLEGHEGIVIAAAFSPDGRHIVTGCGDAIEGQYSARLWDAASGKELRRFDGASEFLFSATFSPDGKQILTGSHDRIARLWDAASGQETQRFVGHENGVLGAGFSPDGRHVLTEGWDDTARLWDPASGKELHRFDGHAGFGASAVFSRDSLYLFSNSSSPRLWEVASGKELPVIDGLADKLTPIAISPDGKQALTDSGDGTLRLLDVRTGRPGQRFAGHPERVSSARFSHQGHYVVSVCIDQSARLWDVATGKELLRLDQQPASVQSVSFSADDRIVLTTDTDGTVQLWDVRSAKPLRRFPEAAAAGAAMLSPDGRRLFTLRSSKLGQFWNAETGMALSTVAASSHPFNSIVFSPDSRRLLTSSDDNTARLFDVETGQQLCQLVSFTDGTWTVTDPAGRFDASNGGDVEGLHWVVGNEPIALNQLKERYYDPGLLAKYMGFKKEPLRDIAAFKEVKLFPGVKLASPTAEKPALGIELTNRGGGIGRVVVKINGKELTADARGPKPDAAAAALQLQVNLADDPRLIPGQPNTVEVLAFNSEGYLSSRAIEAIWEPWGKAEADPIELYAIVGGVSEYADPALSLRFAAKDAEDMALALETGAQRLFGASRVHLTLLATSNHPRAISPTKANFQKAFAEVREKAKPGDVLVVYLAGHGVSLQRGVDTYCYATSEARNLDSAVLSDPDLRAATTISSEELAEWTKQIPAGKQVLILDTCAAGAAATRLTEKRDISGDQIRALDRLKDRTGFHVLLGCAADRVSYEASRYEQGLLTYSLLQGMRGAALREGEFVDVSKLFQYSADQVPQLARDIGGIQAPLIFAPRGTSFDVGQLQATDRSRIPLASVKPLILRPRLSERGIGDDTLDILPLLRKRLNDESYAVRGEPNRASSLVYVDADDLPGAIRPAGEYTVEGTVVKITINLRRDNSTVKTFTAEGSKVDLDGLVQNLVKRIAAGVKDLPP